MRKDIREGPLLASLGDTFSLVHTHLKFLPLAQKLEGLYLTLSADQYVPLWVPECIQAFLI